jgi:DNA-binding MarR family transcriptional regulator
MAGSSTTTFDDLRELVLRIQAAYPRVYLACHTSHQRVGEHGDELSDKDNRILAHLDANRPTSASELAEHLGIRRSTLSAALDRLVERGFVARDARADDRRRVDLRLRPAGAEAMGRSSVLDAERLSTLLERLSPAERADAVRGLELLADAARRAR